MNNFELTDEQKNIVFSKEKKIVIQAFAGCGKTSTVAHFISNIVQENKEFLQISGKIISANSYTKIAAEEMKLRFCKEQNSLNNFVNFSTLDSFIYNDIFAFYFNRIIKMLFKRLGVGSKLIRWNEIKISYDEKDFWKEFKQLKSHNDKYHFLNNQQNMNLAISFWLNELLNNNRMIRGILSEVFLYLFLKSKAENVFEYLNSKFFALVIDEAQDLTYFRMKIINLIADNTEMRVLLAGDDNQAIYQFNGSFPRALEQQIECGFKQYVLNISFRTNEEIKEIEQLINEMEDISDFEKITEQIEDGNVKKLFLFKTNVKCLNFFQKCQEKGKKWIVYSKSIEPKFFSSVDELQRFEMISCIYWNKISTNAEIINLIKKFGFSNKNGLLNSYVEEVCGSNEKNKIKLLKQINSEISANTSLWDLCKKIGVTTPRGWSCEEVSKYENDPLNVYKFINHNFYLIQTIHSSKGTEANFVYLESDYLNDLCDNFFNNDISDEAKNVLYVALTRKKTKNYKIITK